MDQVTLFRALGALGVHPQDLENLRRIPYQHAVEGLKKIQEGVKPQYKKLALELHPDRTGGDESKAKLFSEITMANKWLQDLQMAPPPPPQPRMYVVQRMVHYPGAHPFGGSVTSTTTSATYVAAQVVNIRVIF